MSYDLLVFDPEIAPRERAQFMVWYQELTKWREERDYNTPDGATGNLRKFYDEIRQSFPPMNGPDAVEFEIEAPSPPPVRQGLLARLFGTRPSPAIPSTGFNDTRLTDYCIATHAIYMGFAWSQSDMAYSDVVRAAKITGVGFFDVSATDGVIMHDRAQLDTLLIL